MSADVEKLQAWWNRIQFDTPPWAWRSDPYLDGIDEETYIWLRNLEEPPTERQSGGGLK